MKQIKMTKVSLAVIGALAVLDVGMSSAFAAAEVEIQEMVVTAQKREQKLSEIPQSVQAFSAASMEKAGIKDLEDVIASVPGASEGRSTSASSKSFQIRGVASYYGDSTVGYYIDDAVFSIINRNWAPILGTFDVERVEVLRGPQGTLYGLGAMGGSVKFITTDPNLKKFQARGDVSYSSTKGGDPNWSGNLAVNIPLSEDVVAIRAVASYDHKGGYAESPTWPGEKNILETQNYRLKALAKPTKELTLKASYQHTDERDDKGNQLEYVASLVGGRPVDTFNNNFPASAFSGAPFTPFNQPLTTFNNTKMDVSSVFASYDFGPVTLESSNGYIQAHANNRVPVNGATLNSALNATTFSSELRLISNAKGPLRWIAGLMYLHAESVETVNLQSYSPFAPAAAGGPGIYSLIAAGQPQYDSKSWSQFGEISYDFMDGRLTALAGLRHFEDDRTFIDVQYPHTTGPVFPPGFPAPPAGIVPASSTSYSATFETWNPRWNLSYKLNKDDMVYGNIAKGFRSGVFNSAGTLAILPGTPQAVQPDKLWSYEVGGKFLLLDRKLSVDVAYYHLDWKDMQINFNAPGINPPVQIIANSGNSKGDGVDYQTSYATPLKGLTLSLVGNFNRTKFTNITTPAAFTATNIKDGEQIRSVPKQTHTLSATFRHPLTGDLSMSYYGAYTFIDRQGDLGGIRYSGPGGTSSTLAAPLGNAQKLLKARIGVEGENWGVHLFGENLTNQDEAYYFNGSGWQRQWPRTIGVQASFDY